MIISDDGLRLAFNKRELAILTSVMAEPERPELAALWFHGGQAKAWATDGLRAVMVERELRPSRGNPTARSVAIPAVAALQAAKLADPRDLVVVDLSGKNVTLDVRVPTKRGAKIESFDQIGRETRSKHTATCKRHAGGPETIDHVIPTPHKRGKKGAIVAINANLLPPLVLLAKVAEPQGEIWFNLGGELDPLLVAARADVWTVWRVVIMPRRGNGWPEMTPVQPAAANPGKLAAGAQPVASKPAPPEVANRAKLAPSEAANPGEVRPSGSPAEPTKPAKPRARGRGRGAAKLRAAS